MGKIRRNKWALGHQLRSVDCLSQCFSWNSFFLWVLMRDINFKQWYMEILLQNWNSVKLLQRQRFVKCQIFLVVQNIFRRKRHHHHHHQSKLIPKNLSYDQKNIGWERCLVEIFCESSPFSRMWAKSPNSTFQLLQKSENEQVDDQIHVNLLYLYPGNRSLKVWRSRPNG